MALVALDLGESLGNRETATRRGKVRPSGEGKPSSTRLGVLPCPKGHVGPMPHRLGRTEPSTRLEPGTDLAVPMAVLLWQVAQLRKPK